MSNAKPLLALAAVTLLTGCSSLGLTIDSRTDYASEIAQSSTAAPLSPLKVNAPPFVLSGWQRITQPGAPINLYIEGDGLAWMSRSEPSLNPTPKDPIGLELASLDPAPNVIYLARPCQFTDFDKPGNNCSMEFWTQKRFAAEVINSYMAALDGLAAQHSGRGFNLIGYSGGANIAALLAARRTDILSLRTAAGNLDNDAFTTLHNVSAMPLSLNARNEALKIASLPQMHFVGAQDATVTPQLAQGFKAAAGNSECIGIEVVQAVTHNTGWQQLWPSLLEVPLPCEKANP